MSLSSHIQKAGFSHDAAHINSKVSNQLCVVEPAGLGLNLSETLKTGSSVFQDVPDRLS